MAQTNEEYYENEDIHGDYQYVKLKDIIDGYEFDVNNDDDHYLKNTDRSVFARHAKAAIREVNRSAGNDVLAIEFTVPPSLVWPLPQEYVNYCRVSVNVYDVQTQSWRLEPLDINRRISMAVGYLQDDNYELLYDDNGNILTADSLNAIAVPYRTHKIQRGANTTKLSQWGEFNTSRRQIVFSSELSNREVVIEYVSDGLHAELSDSDITVHKYLRKAIEDYIYHSCITRKRTVPANEKAKAKRDYDTSLHKAKLALAGFDLRQIARSLRIGNVYP